MARIQLALNVSNLNEAVEFYRRLFDAEPAKRKPGYANFAIEDPPLKLVLFESADGGTINHLGVETDDATAVEAAEARLVESGLTTSGIDDTMCCYASKVETWVSDPDGSRWEWYVKTGDSDLLSGDDAADTDDNADPSPVRASCCSPSPATMTLGDPSPSRSQPATDASCCG
jgi:catechol 2,3-dioxygenase-like lactoylglutathione lyase family enzyme